MAEHHAIARRGVETPDDLRDLIAPALTRAREHRGYSKGQVARGVGVARGVVTYWEHGIHRPSDQNILRLAAFLDQPIAFFFKTDGELDDVT